MTATHGSKIFGADGRSLVYGLARSVLSEVSAMPHDKRERRLNIGVSALYAAVTHMNGFELELTRRDMAALRLSRTDIVDHCIPAVARLLGDDWVNDRMTFAAVTSASSRLFALCKSAGAEWDNVRPDGGSMSLILATLDREDHILGPAVVADQLRRRGHSVQLLTNATPSTLADRASTEDFDGILLSASSWQNLEAAAIAVRKIQEMNSRAVVVVGGSILSETGFDPASTNADLTTNDIDAALQIMKGDGVSLRAVE